MLNFNNVGMWTISFNLGNFVGPTVSGFLVEDIGFPNTTMVFVAMYLVMVCVNTTELIITRKKHAKQNLYREI